MLRTAVALSALAFFLAGCVYVDWNSGGGYYHGGGPYRGW